MSESHQFLCFPSFLKSEVCLLFGEGGHGDGRGGGDDGGGGGHCTVLVTLSI